MNCPPSGPGSFIATFVKLGLLIKRRRPSAIVAYHTAHFASVVFASRWGSPNTRIVVGVNEYPFFIHRRGIRRWVVDAMPRLACKLADSFWVLTPQIAKELYSYGVPKRKIRVLPSSVDLNLVSDTRDMQVDHPAFERKDVPIIITACRLVPVKRLDILLQAASLLAPIIKFNIVILGEDQGNLRESLQRLASRLNIGHRTFFLGFQSNPWKFMSKAAVFVVSSDYEAFGNVLIEAMACRVPVVSTRAPVGPEYIIVNEESGLLVQPRNPHALANGIRRLLVDRELRQRCIEGGLKRASDFTVETYARRVNCALEDLLAQKRA